MAKQLWDVPECRTLSRKFPQPSLLPGLHTELAEIPPRWRKARDCHSIGAQVPLVWNGKERLRITGPSPRMPRTWRCVEFSISQRERKQPCLQIRFLRVVCAWLSRSALASPDLCPAGFQTQTGSWILSHHPHLIGCTDSLASVLTLTFFGDSGPT